MPEVVPDSLLISQATKTTCFLLVLAAHHVAGGPADRLKGRKKKNGKKKNKVPVCFCWWFSGPAQRLFGDLLLVVVVCFLNVYSYYPMVWLDNI